MDVYVYTLHHILTIWAEHMNSEQRRSSILRILTVSDKVEPVLYGPDVRERGGKVEV